MNSFFSLFTHTLLVRLNAIGVILTYPFKIASASNSIEESKFLISPLIQKYDRPLGSTLLSNVSIKLEIPRLVTRNPIISFFYVVL